MAVPASNPFSPKFGGAATALVPASNPFSPHYASVSTSAAPATNPFSPNFKAPQQKGGGGWLGSAIGGVEGALGGGAHWIASKADLAAHDLAAMPTGVEQALKTTYDQTASRLTGNSTAQAKADAQSAALGKSAIQGAVTSVEHPFRDPFQTALTIAPAVGQLGKLGLVADAARTGDFAGAAKALASSKVAAARLGDRIVNVPKLVAPEGEGPAQLVHEPASLVPSQNPAVRLAQAAHDAIIQRSLDNNASVEEPSALANYANTRVAKTTDEIARTAQRTRLVPAQMLERAGAHLPGRTAFDDGVSNKAGQLALFLRSANVTGKEAADYWTRQAQAGVNPVSTGALAKLAQNVHDQGVLKVGEDGNVAVDATKYPKLGNADDLVKENQATRAGVISSHRLMTPEGMATRLALVARTMSGENGPVSADTRSTLAQISKLEGLQKARFVPGRAEHVAKYSGVEQKLAKLRASLPASPTEETQPLREGQGYTPLATSVKRQPQTPIARARGPVIGIAQRFIGGKAATGEGIARGLIPDNTTAGVARASREALRYLGTVEHRGLVARYGSDVKRTGEDALVADPVAETHGEIPLATNELLGRSQSTLNTISEAEHAGLAAGMRARLEDAIPGMRDKFATDNTAALGTRAPEGYKWVPKQQLGSLVHETAPRSAITKKINDVNSAVTAATVYFKLSHIPQRLTTNATTSVVSGAAFSPASLRFAMNLRKELSNGEYAEAVAASGAHGYLALPHEGTSHVAQIATKGAQFYARRVDSPFRFVNLVHEARKAGFDTPEKFRQLIEHAKNPTEAGNAADTAQMDNVLRRANRASMMYDGLGENEQRILARGLWFFPWTKAATRFAGHTIAEHPIKAAVGGELGQIGEQRQNQILGALPSYEYGLTPFGSGSHPSTSDFSILTPYGTAANVAEAVARPGSISNFANPVAGAGLTAATGVNQYGGKTKKPIGDALSELLAPTPEAQILSAYLHPPRPSQIFKKTPLSALIRSVGGPSVPRLTNRAALNSAAARQRAGR